MGAFVAWIVTGLGIFAFLASALAALDLAPEPKAPEGRILLSPQTSLVEEEGGISSHSTSTYRRETAPLRQESLHSQQSDTSSSTHPFTSRSSASSREGGWGAAALLSLTRKEERHQLGAQQQPMNARLRASTRSVAAQIPTLPSRLFIPTIDLEAPVHNTTTTDIPTLDRLLKKGAVRYPTSARIGEEGTMVIFGHSSGRPVVINPNYKLFNRLHELQPGDEIMVQGGGWEEVYTVRRVRLVEVDGARIALNLPGKYLVLVTCNSLGSKEERYVVEAAFVGRFPVSALSGKAQLANETGS